ncbi:hypothetical protein EV182_007308, partial [Spiromyces aspiralis]
MLPPFLTSSSTKSISFAVYEGAKGWLRRHDVLSKYSRAVVGGGGLVGFNLDTVGSVALTSSCAGAYAGVIMALMTCPLELVKIQMQLSRLMNRSGDGNAGQGLTNIQAFREILR